MISHSSNTHLHPSSTNALDPNTPQSSQHSPKITNGLHSLDVHSLCHFIAQYIVQKVIITDALIYFVPSVEFIALELKQTSTTSTNEITVPLVEKFLLYIYNLCQLEYECLISSVIYLKRMEKISEGKFRLTKSNWKISLLLCLMTSSKMLDDFSMENRDFTIAFDLICLSQMNQLEILFLDLLQYQLIIPIKEYQECFHEAILMKNRSDKAVLHQTKILKHPQSPSSFSPRSRPSPKTPIQLKPPQSSHPQQVSPQSVTLTSSFDVSPSPLSLPTSSSPLFDSIEFLSLTLLRNSSISGILLSCFERDDDL
jgi:hypothetical protein